MSEDPPDFVMVLTVKVVLVVVFPMLPVVSEQVPAAEVGLHPVPLPADQVPVD